MCHENQLNKCKLALYKSSIHFKSGLKQLYISSKMECFSYKGGRGMTRIEVFKKEPAVVTYKWLQFISNIMLVMPVRTKE